ncbi:MAG: hypothetical protein F6K41_21660 [Symploca sp. SIO3E6]|nr:hypothetical protein [Caldora sp. SIO3E6]
MKNQTDFNLTKIAIALHFLLTPLILGAIAYEVINSNFEGLIQMKLNQDGGEILIDSPTTSDL